MELDYNFRRRTLDKRLEEVRENLTYAQLIVIEQLLKDCEEEKKP